MASQRKNEKRACCALTPVPDSASDEWEECGKKAAKEMETPSGEPMPLCEFHLKISTGEIGMRSMNDQPTNQGSEGSGNVVPFEPVD